MVCNTDYNYDHFYASLKIVNHSDLNYEWQTRQETPSQINHSLLCLALPLELLKHEMGTTGKKYNLIRFSKQAKTWPQIVRVDNLIIRA